MTSLPQLQQSIARQLHELSGDLAVISPIGAGVRTAVVDFLMSTIRQGPILVVTDRVDIAYQWMERLRSASLPVRMLSSRADAIEWIGAESGRESAAFELVITTVQRLNVGPLRQGGVRRSLQLLIVDVPALPEGGVVYQLVDVLKAASPKSIFLSSTMHLIVEVRFDAVLHISLAEVLQAYGATLTFERVTYERSLRDTELLSQAAIILERLGQSDAAQSLQGAHAALIDAVAGEELENSPVGAKKEMLEDAWKLIDELEDTSGDSRLAALVRVVESANQSGGWTVVLSHRLSEQEYVASALSKLGMVVVSPEVGDASSNDFSDGVSRSGVLVTSPRRLVQYGDISANAVVIWGASSERAQLQDVLVWTALRRSKLTLLHASQPSAMEGRTMAAVERACMEFEEQLSVL